MSQNGFELTLQPEEYGEPSPGYNQDNLETHDPELAKQFAQIVGAKTLEFDDNTPFGLDAMMLMDPAVKPIHAGHWTPGIKSDGNGGFVPFDTWDDEE